MHAVKHLPDSGTNTNFYRSTNDGSTHMKARMINKFEYKDRSQPLSPDTGEYIGPIKLETILEISPVQQETKAAALNHT